MLVTVCGPTANGRLGCFCTIISCCMSNGYSICIEVVLSDNNSCCTVSLLLYLVAGKKGVYDGIRIYTDLRSPFAESVAVPLNVLLMIRRHMRLYHAVLIGSSVKPRVGTNTFSAKEYFHRGSCDPDVDLLLDVLIRDRVILLVYGNMVIRCHRRNLPF